MKPTVRILLTDIAAKELGIPTLEMRRSDSLDFHEVGVASLAEALALAYKAGQTAVPVELPELKQQIAYHVEFHAPAGTYRDVIIADTPQEALAQARIKAETNVLEDFDPVAESYCIQRITVAHPDDGEQAFWTDPASLAQLHADEILHELEELIDAVDDMAESRGTLDERISNVESSATATARVLKTLGLKGGVQ